MNRHKLLSTCLVVALVVLLAGCSMFKEATAQAVAVDTWCLSARKKMWSRQDHPETIRDARIHNELVDRKCGAPKS